MDDAWSDYADKADEAWNSYFSQEKAGEVQVDTNVAPTEAVPEEAHQQLAGNDLWSDEDFVFGDEDDAEEESSLSEDEGYSEDVKDSEQEEVEQEIDEEAIEAGSEGEEESSTEDEPELPSTVVIKVNGLQTTLDFDMSNPRAREKYKKAAQLAGGYKQLHGQQSVLRNELKDTDLSFLKVDDPYTKEGMKRIGSVVKAMSTLQGFVESGDLEGLFATLTRSDEHPEGINLKEYAEGLHQSKIDYEDMTPAEQRAFDAEKQLQESRRKLAQYERAQELKSEQLAKEAQSLKSKERENQVIPVFHNNSIKASDVGGNAVQARKLNKVVWNEIRTFCKEFEAKTGQLPDQATLVKQIAREKAELLGTTAERKRKAEISQKKKARSQAQKKAAKAVKGESKRVSSLKSTDHDDIASHIKNLFS